VDFFVAKDIRRRDLSWVLGSCSSHYDMARANGFFVGHYTGPHFCLVRGYCSGRHVMVGKESGLAGNHHEHVDDCCSRHLGSGLCLSGFPPRFHPSYSQVSVNVGCVFEHPRHFLDSLCFFEVWRFRDLLYVRCLH